MVANKQDRRERDTRRGRLGLGRYQTLVKSLVGVTRLAFEARATATLLGLEGPLRHAIRSDLCLQSWGWAEADAMAREVLGDAFRKVGATRPTWNEGQRDWTVEAGTLIERTCCVRCHGPLPDGRPKFCSDLCKRSHYNHLGSLRAATEDQVLQMAVRST